MSAFSAHLTRKHIENQAPAIHDTFLCAICGLSKSIMGRTMHSKTGMRRRWQCVMCTAKAKGVQS